ncbi:MAG: cytochrome P450 [Marinobacterium sp.]|nr:cytochrome P450 [Marinobacterium sp.]
MELLNEIKGKIKGFVEEEGKSLFETLINKHPDEFFKVLRETKPILSVPGKFVLVTRFDDVQEALSRPEVFTVKPYQRAMDPSVGPFMLARDGTTINSRDKGIMRAVLRREDLPQVREMVAGLARQAIEQGARDGQLEVVSMLSRMVPVKLTGEYFGFPGPDVETMKRWSYWTQYDMFHNQDLSELVHTNNVRSGHEMKAYLLELATQRRKEIAAGKPGNDVFSRLLETHLPDVIGFDEARILTNTMGLLVGGVETTSAAIVQILDQLFDRPEQYEALINAARQGDDATVYDICWEALRFNPINPFVVRLCAEDYTLAAGSSRETLIKAGTPVLISGRSAMMDSHQVPDPEDFISGRPAYHYMHMGYGLHTCLGDHVSRVQIPEIIKQLVLSGKVSRAPGAAGQLDFKGGPFPESFSVCIGSC